MSFLISKGKSSGIRPAIGCSARQDGSQGKPDRASVGCSEKCGGYLRTSDGARDGTCDGQLSEPQRNLFGRRRHSILRPALRPARRAPLTQAFGRARDIRISSRFDGVAALHGGDERHEGQRPMECAGSSRSGMDLFENSASGPRRQFQLGRPCRGGLTSAQSCQLLGPALVDQRSSLPATERRQVGARVSLAKSRRS